MRHFSCATASLLERMFSCATASLLERMAIIAGSLIVLSACVAAPPLFETQSYQQMDWAKKSFEAMRAECRHREMSQNKNGKALLANYWIDETAFKACMERFGYHYLGPTGLLGSSGAYAETSRAQ